MRDILADAAPTQTWSLTIDAMQDMFLPHHSRTEKTLYVILLYLFIYFHQVGEKIEWE